MEENNTVRTGSVDVTVETNPVSDTALTKSLYVTIFLLFLTWIITANLTLIVVTLKYQLFQEPNRLVRVAMSVVDILMATTGVIFMSEYILMDHQKDSLVIRIIGVLLVGAYFLNNITTTLLIVERYIYMAYPLNYIHWLTPKVTVSVILGFAAFVLAYMIFSEATLGRTFSSSALLPQLPRSISHMAFQVVFSQILPVAICVYVLFKMSQMKRSLIYKRNKISPQWSETLSTQWLPRKKIKSIFKTTLLISGSLWFSYFPGFVLRTVVLFYYTTEELDSGVNVFCFHLLRASTIILGYVSAGINPAIQFAMEKDLRAGFLKLLGKPSDFIWQKLIKEATNFDRNFRENFVRNPSLQKY